MKHIVVFVALYYYLLVSFELSDKVFDVSDGRQLPTEEVPVTFSDLTNCS